MVKSFVLPLFLLAAATLHAEVVPALVIGDATKVALQEIVSVKFDASHIRVCKTDGSVVTESLLPITWGSTEIGSGIQQMYNDAAAFGYALYTLDGRLVRQGLYATHPESFAGVNPGDYILCMGGQSIKLHFTEATSSLPLPTSHISSYSSHPLTVGEPVVRAMQVSLPGIDVELALARVDSLSFAEDQLYLHEAGKSHAFALNEVQTIVFPELSIEVALQYEGEQVEGINPYYFDGVSIVAQGAGITVNNPTLQQEVEYQLSGSSDNGYFKIYSEYKWKANLMGLTLTNPNGPVINSQTGKKGTVKSQNGYVNTLSDGANYATSTEDQKAAIFSEGQLIFSGKGTLNLTSMGHHAICSDDYVSFENGTINVLGAGSDAVHAKDSVLVQSGTITLASSSDGIDCDGPITIRRGENGAPILTITTTANGAKGIKTGADFLMSAGTVTINQTGGPDKTGSDTSNVISVKADGNITITGGVLNINNKANGGKGLSAGGSIAISESATVRQ